VLEAVLAGDAVAAGREMQRHLTHTADLLEHQLSLP
jgi:DNA-binding GntR family transcriptional regulator